MGIFEDAERGTYADLSTCQLWTRTLNDHGNDFQRWLDTRLVSAVLWRLLHNWEGSTASASQQAVPAGPVLEVLFLATSFGSRGEGEGKTLVTELEEAARSLGCAAMCVAAVPKQGVGFWKRCGYTVRTHLLQTAQTPQKGTMTRTTRWPRGVF